jgi:hypothetical protein
MPALPDKLLDEICQFMLRGRSSRVLRRTEFGGGGVLRQDDLNYEQVCTIAISELSGPANSLIRRFRTVGADHDTSYGVVLRLIYHNL